ncbi:hypothetical protein [Methanolacinia paynteri]|uniref:hypothetical protein n=1 Tax=Methanolacinia paynteri TaxID=230356 RepID=UPI00064F66FE|nr:hypothetical protein [Methanolacinia paynteri]
MKIYTKIALIAIFGLFILSIGLISIQSTDSPISYQDSFLKYDIQDNQEYDYEINISSKEQSLNVLKNLEMSVDKAENEDIYEKYVLTTASSAEVENSYIIQRTDQGKIIDINSKTPIIPEVQPEFPNLLEFPEKTVEPGMEWTTVFDKSGDSITKNGTIKYEATGTSDFEIIGKKVIITESGNFDCVGIKQTVNYSIKESIVSKNETLNSEKYGYYTGENWINLENGILIRSSFNHHRVISADLSESYQGFFGFEKIYREVPIDFQIVTELTEVRNN